MQRISKKDLKDTLDASNITASIPAKDVNKATEEIIEVIQTTAERHTPLKEIKVGNRKNYIPWLNENHMKSH